MRDAREVALGILNAHGTTNADALDRAAKLIEADRRAAKRELLLEMWVRRRHGDSWDDVWHDFAAELEATAT